ncbi:unnamed protein product [Blepharisma stoltei]|uniref:SET domain-containing protein n=1 Tax=Blepharisma stoltei TaxID=1481888 RepID=A0AAU9IRJ7_9CILI|nr:unnamed protein product [Blepharisma stoltei]
MLEIARNSCEGNSHNLPNQAGFKPNCIKKSQKRNKPLPTFSLPAVRAPSSYGEIEQMFKEVAKIDDSVGYFRDMPQKNYQKIIKEIVNKKTMTCEDTAEDNPLAIIINKNDLGIPMKKLRLSYKEVFFEECYDIIEENEPEFVTDLEEYDENKITSLDYIYRHNVITNKYYSASQVKKDLETLIKNKMLHTQSDCERIYIRAFWKEAKKVLEESDIKIRASVLLDWNEAIKVNYLAAKVNGPWFKGEYASRKYEIIEDYVTLDNGETYKRLATSKKGHCNGIDCDSFDNLGPYDLRSGTWISENSDRKEKVECSNDCACSPDHCLNRQLSKSQGPKLGLDVVEKPSWGFDVYTYRSILGYIMHPITADSYYFIGTILPKAINSVASNNWDIRESLKLIINDRDNIFTLRHKRYSQGLLNAISSISEIIGSEAALSVFKIHPKGTGVFCLRKEGISRNSLIVEYVGELYSPALWFEKQDVIKHFNNSMKNSVNATESVPDFYNIMLERHYDDPEGYDVLIIDPIVKGSFGSRLSHSCSPNCGTVTMISEGKYTIGIYALNNISYLDELTFDYNSFTESKEEHLQSVCLCSSSICRGYYLAFAQNSSNSGYSFSFLHRKSSIIKASYGQFSKEDLEICSKYHIRSAILNKSPEWLKVWISLTVRDIDLEINLLGSEIEKKIALDARLQNLAITIDKIKYCLSKTSLHMPIRVLTSEQALDYIWGNESKSVKNQLLELQQRFSLNILDLLREDIYELDSARRQLLKIRDKLRIELPTRWIGAGIADMIHLIAYTQTFYKENKYESFESDLITIHPCEVSKSLTEEVNKTTHKKKYSSYYVHGLLNGWYKQCVEKPNAVLASEKRGTVTLSSINGACDLEYCINIRNILLKHLRKRPSSPWPIKKNKSPWSNYSNPAKVFGSPMLDCFYSDPEALNRCLNDIDKVESECTIPHYFSPSNVIN